MKEHREAIAHVVGRLLDVSGLDIPSLIKNEEGGERGDLALPCFVFAKKLRRNPKEVAEELAEAFAGEARFSKVEAKGPFLNFTFDAAWLSESVLPNAVERGKDWGRAESSAGKTVTVDFSSPNIAKPLAFHHLRSTSIGNALANLYEALGWRVVRINHLGDWGTQFGKLAVAFLKWGDETTLERDKIKHLLELYVRYTRESEADPSLDDEARSLFLRMEQGDEEALALWRRFREESLNEFNRLYSRLGIRFDTWDGESYYNDRLDDVVEEVEKKVGTEVSEGATIVRLDDLDIQPVLLKKSDGATLYATRDLAAAIDRFERFSYDLSLYVIGAQQSLHCQQFFAVLQKMGFDWADRLVHVPFGWLKGMSTRKGQVVFLDDVLDEVVDLSRKAISEKNPGLPMADEVAEQVGVGAVIFGDLVNWRMNDVTFDWGRILNFQGETGVYVQYTHARCRSVLRKAGHPDLKGFDPALLTLPEEKSLVKLIGAFPETIEEAAVQYDPSKLARMLIDTAKAFGRLWNMKEKGYVFLEEDTTLRLARLALVTATANTLANGLSVLGVPAPKEM